MVRIVGAKEPIVGDVAWRVIFTAGWIGALNGVIVWLTTYFLANFVINNIACRMGTSLVSCGETGEVSAVVALVVAAIVSLIFLVRWRIYRPLLAAIAATVTMWGIGGSWLAITSGWGSFFVLVLVSSLVYVLFVWLAKIRSFGIALVVTAIVVLLMRLIVIS